jgi:KaiC/GvpD/RAD55 family RecA-like ATPase
MAKKKVKKEVKTKKKSTSKKVVKVNKKLKKDSDVMIKELTTGKKIKQKKIEKPKKDDFKTKPKTIKKQTPTKPLKNKSTLPNKTTTTQPSSTPKTPLKTPSKASAKPSGPLDVSKITQEVKNEMISKQRKPVEGILGLKDAKTNTINRYIMTGVPGFDDLLKQGIPRGGSIIVAGGTGSGKTIFCLQTLNHHATKGKKCLYITFEENEDRLCSHMTDFGWDAMGLIKKGNLKIMRMNPFDITRNVDAMLAKQKGELLIDIDPMIIPADYQPDIIAIDSLTAIASAFSDKSDSYRIYIEQLFRFLEQIGSTNLLITETEQVPKIFSPTGVEEFLADGVFVLYSLKHGNVRENAIEILKLRGAAHQKKIVAMQVTGNGIMVYPEQEVFSETD